MLHGLSSNSDTHSECTKLGVPKILAELLNCNDLETQIQACLCVRHLSVCHEARFKFIEAHGLPALFSLSKTESIELKREAVAALRNISICNQGKLLIVKDIRREVLRTFAKYFTYAYSNTNSSPSVIFFFTIVGQVFVTNGLMSHHLHE